MKATEVIKIMVVGKGEVDVKPGDALADVADAAGLDDVLIASTDGRLVDLSTPAKDVSEVEFLTYEDAGARDAFLHSASHVMAHALTELYPGIKLTIGPAITNGFYYDFDPAEPISESDLPSVEAKMAELVEANLPIERREISKDEAHKLFAENEYKLELIDEIEGDTVSIYTQSDFVDLCEGPHVPSTGVITNFKLTAVAGAYWRGSENYPMLVRIYGTAYRTEDELQAHHVQIEEAKRRDHRRLAKDLDLFSLGEDIGAGLVYWHPKGAFIRHQLEEFWKEEHRKRGYELVYTPHIGAGKLYEKSGHFQYYLDNMYVFDVEGTKYVLKPMNCPMHVAIYTNSLHSYRELPIRYAELGTVYRRERSGTLHGLLRVRGFTQDDAHIFCRPDQLVDELVGCVDFAIFLLNTLGFEEYRIDLSARDPEHPEDYAGTPEEWETAEKALAEALERMNLEYVYQPGEAVFYGPKIDFQIFDALGRKWQGPTIQFDFNLPTRFDVKYTGSDGAEHLCYLIHRALYGSLERFFGMLTEHYAGLFPLWLAPVQLRILPVTDDFAEYASEAAGRIRAEGLRVELDGASEKLGARIRKGELEKIPYLAVVGEKEKGNATVSLRRHGGTDLGEMTVEAAAAYLKNEAESKTTNP
ncbi:MAG: threonine--tRNA ligase [Candidatus Coatesbacteria bacterium]|nr:MAG: threonine--tRNA ligase [Candidatus Coatesbacteria bacterium]